VTFLIIAPYNTLTYLLTYLLQSMWNFEVRCCRLTASE